MELTVTLPEGLARRVEALARAQGRAVDAVVVEAVERAVPLDPEVEAAARARFSFVGVGEARPDLAERHKEIRRERLAGGEAAEV